MFKVSQVMHPPLHARKTFTYKLNEHDYFGSYSKKRSMLVKVDYEKL